MKRQEFEQALAKARQAEKRNFKQSVEVIINLRGLNLKKPEEQVDFFHNFPHNPQRKRKVCALVGAELKEQAEQFCDRVVLNDEFSSWEGKKKEIKKLASDYDYFIAQAPFMAQVAKTFGRQFGPKGKMPNPKAGCVVPPNANLEQLTQKLQSLQKVQAKSKPLIQCLVGKEDMDDKKIIENITSLFQALVNKLPGEESNVRSVYIKLTMGAPVKVGEVDATGPAKAEKKSKAAPAEQAAKTESSEKDKSKSEKKPKEGEEQ